MLSSHDRVSCAALSIRIPHAPALRASLSAHKHGENPRTQWVSEEAKNYFTNIYHLGETPKAGKDFVVIDSTEDAEKPYMSYPSEP